MNIIRILPDSLISKIAAGEVVARPASAVKELIDNAIDAKATSIEIDIKNGGSKQITIIDNGSGMSFDDALLSISQHATSKISNEHDLENIETMGFRGEALAAIASVSKLEIETKLNDPNIIEGTMLRVEGDVIMEHRATGCPAGTKISISDLFFNTPARKKFLRSDSVELSHIANTVDTMALYYNDINFKLTNNGAKKSFYPKTNNAIDRISDVMGKEIRNSLTEFEDVGENLKIRGFLGKPDIAKANAKSIYLFLNKRPIKDRILQHALLMAYESVLTRGLYPVSVIFLEIANNLVDVNVHPTKNEVRFTNSGMVHDFIAASVRKAISKRSIPVLSPDQPTNNTTDTISPFPETFYRPARQTSVSPFSFLTPKNNSETPDCTAKTQAANNSAGTEPSFNVIDTSVKVIGQFNNSFIICEHENGQLIIVDQHAAHERLGFEFLKSQYHSGHIKQQRLLIPENIILSAKELVVIEENKELIEKSGFELEVFSGNSIVIKAVPEILGNVSLKHIFEKLADEFSDFESSSAIKDSIEKIFSVIACHRQVRAGDQLTKQELEELVKDIEKYNITHCPHGRPAVVSFDTSDIEKWFKRS